MSAGTNESTVARRALASDASRAGPRAARVVSSGVSPERTSTSSAPASAGSALRTASPVPSGRSWIATSRPSNSSAVSGEATTTSGVGAERPGRLDDPVDHPAAEDRMQVLGGRRAHACPPASGHHDGCELGAGFGHGRHVGWGARIRTWDHGTKTRCLTTWPRPSESGRRVYPDARSPRARQAGQRRSRSSTVSATAASRASATSARTPTSTIPTGTSTTMSCDTAATHETARTPGDA